MRTSSSLLVTLSALLLAAVTSALAVAPRTVNYQGRLYDDGGQPVTADITLDIAIYDDSTGGNMKWSETIENVEVNDGLFNVILGLPDGIPDSVFREPDRYLGVSVSGDAEMTPRTPFTTSPYAFTALEADTADYALDGPFVGGSGSAGYIPVFTGASTVGNSVIVQSSGLIGVNQASPTASLHVRGGNASTPVLRVEGSTSPSFEAGPAVVITAGQGGAVNPGGDVTVTGGRGGEAISGTGGSGGNIGVYGGDGNGSVAVGGNVRICGGNGELPPPLEGGDGNVLLAINATGTVRGDVGVKTLSPSYDFDVAGDIGCVVLHESSDRRLKQDIEPITDVLERLDAVDCVSFKWNEDAVSRGAQPGRQNVGVIAQELEAVFPALVSTGKDGYKSVEYGKLAAVLLVAVKELRQENEELRRDVDALKAQLTE